MQIFVQTSINSVTHAALQRETDRLRNLGDLLDWVRSLVSPVPSPAVVTQDEYTHDIVVPWRPPLVLAFDTT